MSVHERYNNDAQFRQLVDYMIFLIQRAQFTPSELREAAILVSIKYEQRRIPDLSIALQEQVIRHLKVAESLLDKEVERPGVPDVSYHDEL